MISCGVSVRVEEGRIRQIAGDASHFVSGGSLCAKCSLAYNGAWIDPDQRLTKPLRRVGPKGGATFEPVSWAEALSDIANRLNAILADHGADSILQTHYTGTCSAIAGNFPLRFFRRLGAREVDPDTVCNKAGHVALNYVVGDSRAGFDPRTLKDSACLMVWGGNPSAAAPHIHRNWVRSAGHKVIVIDPVAHATARAADIHLQLKPGSDAALAFGMMHIIEKESLLDHAFLARHTIGWPDIARQLREMTPERTQALTGVQTDQLAAAAIAYAQGPSMLWLGQGMQRQRMGGNAFRSAAALVAATGNIGKPGAGLLYLNGAGTRGVDIGYVAGAEMPYPAPALVSQMDLSRLLADRAATRALFCWNNNIVASNPDQAKLRAALTREDLLHVVVDLFATDTADYADYVLPAASFLEFNDVLLPYFFNVLSAQAKIVEPMGESLPNQEIFRRLARAMAYEDAALFESDEAIIAKILRETGYAGAFDDLAKAGTVEVTAEPIISFAGGLFPTPSGKMELASDRAAADGHPAAPFPYADEAATGGRLRLLSPASDWTMNSSYGNDAKVRRRLAKPSVWLNGLDARRRNLREGAHVELANETGASRPSSKFRPTYRKGSPLSIKDGGRSTIRAARTSIASIPARRPIWARVRASTP